jgi:hypothetical protein
MFVWVNIRLVYSFRARIDGRSLVGALQLELISARHDGGTSARRSSKRRRLRRRYRNDNEAGDDCGDDADDESDAESDAYDDDGHGSDDDEVDDEDNDEDEERKANAAEYRGMTLHGDLAAALTFTGCARCGTELRGDANGIYRCARTECAVGNTSGAQPSRYDIDHDPRNSILETCECISQIADDRI